MPDRQSSDGPTAGSASPGSGTATRNIFGDVQNLLGFLLAGSGAILSFLGLRSTEVTTVLRNNAGPASLLALIFLLGILAAVLTVVIDDTASRASWASAGSLVVALLGLGVLVIHLIPVGSAAGLSSLVLGCVLVSAGMVFLLISTVARRRPVDATGLFLILLAAAAFIVYFTPLRQRADHRLMNADLILGGAAALLGLILLIPPRASRELRMARARRAQGAAEESAARGDEAAGEAAEAQQASRGNHGWYGWQPVDRLPLTSVLVITSVMLIAIGTYGGMRLESKSQLSFSTQVGTAFSVNGPTATASIKIATTKLAQDDWIFVYVYGVPTGTKLASMCSQYVIPAVLAEKQPKNQTAEAALTRSYLEHCRTDPCYYFAPGNREGWPSACDVLLSGSIDPNAAGDVNETLSVPFKTSSYEDVDVRPEVCQPNPAASCEGAVTGQNSRLDWVIAQPQSTAPS